MFIGRQPSAKHVDIVMETQRNAIELLKILANCLVKECASWNSNVQALIKAQREEQKALEKARIKAEKEEEKQVQKAKKKAEQQEKARREKTEKDQANGDGCDHADAESKTKKSRPVRGGCAEISEADFPVLYHGSKIASGLMPILQDVDSFVTMIADNPHLACVTRLRRGPFKKVLVVPRLFSFFLFVHCPSLSLRGRVRKMT